MTRTFRSIAVRVGARLMAFGGHAEMQRWQASVAQAEESDRHKAELLQQVGDMRRLFVDEQIRCRRIVGQMRTVDTHMSMGNMNLAQVNLRAAIAEHGQVIFPPKAGTVGKA